MGEGGGINPALQKRAASGWIRPAEVHFVGWVDSPTIASASGARSGRVHPPHTWPTLLRLESLTDNLRRICRLCGGLSHGGLRGRRRRGALHDDDDINRLIAGERGGRGLGSSGRQRLL